MHHGSGQNLSLALTCGTLLLAGCSTLQDSHNLDPSQVSPAAAEKRAAAKLYQLNDVPESPYPELVAPLNFDALDRTARTLCTRACHIDNRSSCRMGDPDSDAPLVSSQPMTTITTQPTPTPEKTR